MEPLNKYNPNIIKTNKKGYVWAIIACLLPIIAWKIIPHPLVVLAVSILPLAIIFVLKKSFLIILLFIIFSFFRIHEALPQIYNFKIPLLLSLASIASLGWHIGITQKIRLFWNPQLTILSIFFIAVIIGVIFASNRPIAIDYFKNIYWKIIIMTYAIAFLARSPKEFSMASQLITLAGILIGIVALYNKNMSIGLVEGTRVTIGRDLGSVLGDPNDLALVLMFPFAFAASLVANTHIGKLARFIGFIGIPILFMAVIATQSRGGLLGVLAIIGFYLNRNIKSKALLITIGAILAMALFVFAGISDRQSGGAAEEGLDASAQGRLYAWGAAFGMAVAHPITGVGIDNFYYNYYLYSSHWDGLNHAVHSTWFGVLAETGFVGFIIFICMITTLLKSAFHSMQTIQTFRSSLIPKQNSSTTPTTPTTPQTVPKTMEACSQAIFSGLLGILISGTFLTHGFTWPIYILAGLVIALSHWTHINCKTS